MQMTLEAKLLPRDGFKWIKYFLKLQRADNFSYRGHITQANLNPKFDLSENLTL